MSYTPVYIICSPRPLVGKTLTARLMCEFLLLKNGDVIGFDINLKEPSLLEYLPRVTETADVIDTFGKMALMDRLIVNDGMAKVIDLGFHAFDEFFKMSEEIGFVKEAARQGVAPMVLFVLDQDFSSSRAYAMLERAVPPSALVAINNEAVLYGEVPSWVRARRTIEIQRYCPDFLEGYIDKGDDFVQRLRPHLGRTPSSELYDWISRYFLNFREIELSLIACGRQSAQISRVGKAAKRCAHAVMTSDIRRHGARAVARVAVPRTRLCPPYRTAVVMALSAPARAFATVTGTGGAPDPGIHSEIVGALEREAAGNLATAARDRFTNDRHHEHDSIEHDHHEHTDILHR